MRSADHPGNGWKIKKRKHTKIAVFYVCVIFWEQSGRAGVENGAMLTTYLFRYRGLLQNAPFRSQIFNIFFASGRNGALTPLTKILADYHFLLWNLSKLVHDIYKYSPKRWSVAVIYLVRLLHSLLLPFLFYFIYVLTKAKGQKRHSLTSHTM